MNGHDMGLMSQCNEDHEAAGVAAATLYLLENSIDFLETHKQDPANLKPIEDLIRMLRDTDRDRRARALAAYLGKLSVQLESWSLR
jgi:hypothetical protein